MKQILLLLIPFFAACRKENIAPAPETPVTKEVEFRVFAARDYSAPVFQNINVDLRLQVNIINYKTGDMKLVWDSVFSTRKLTGFPPYHEATVIKKTFPVLDSHEKLNGAYSVKYNNNGTINQEAASDEAGPGKTKILIEADM